MFTLRVRAIFKLLILLLYYATCNGNKCTKQCDKNNNGLTVQFCGTDFELHQVSVNQTSCYRKCDVSAWTPGNACECPNYCYHPFDMGECVSGCCCKCKPGWQGIDCSQVKCPDMNGCSGFKHGECIQEDKHHFGDYCRCENGWTGPYCSIPINEIPVLPYGELFNGEEYWSDSDKYKDNHPIFNLSVIATIKIKLSEDNLKYLLDPKTAFTQEYVPATFAFDNGNVIDKLSVGIHLKGAHTRTMLKKSWKISFTKFGGKKWYQLKKLSLKYALNDPAVIREQIVSEMYRAVGVPSSRSSFADVWINDIHWGLYWLEESIDRNFIKSHYKHHHGNLYTCNNQNFLEYLGDNPEMYQKWKFYKYGWWHNHYEQDGDGKWDDLIEFIKILHLTDDNDFTKKINGIFSVNKFLRALIVEVFTSNQDNYSLKGNNYLLYYNPKYEKFEILMHDTDLTFHLIDRDIFENWSVNKAILTRRILNVNEYRDTYIQYFNYFLYNITDNILIYRIHMITNMIIQIIERDYYFRLDFGRTMELYRKSLKELELFFPKRREFIINKLKSQLE